MLFFKNLLKRKKEEDELSFIRSSLLPPTNSFAKRLLKLGGIKKNVEKISMLSSSTSFLYFSYTSWLTTLLGIENMVPEVYGDNAVPYYKHYLKIDD